MKAKSRTASSEAANLRRGDPRALHEQLSARLRTEFVATHPPGEQLPTEEAICQTYGLSRVTVRRAIQTLVDQGLLIRRQGKGTFIAPPRPHITYEIDRLGPFMDAFAASGEQVTAHLVDFYWGTEKQVPECFAPIRDRRHAARLSANRHSAASRRAHQQGRHRVPRRLSDFAGAPGCRALSRIVQHQQRAAGPHSRRATRRFADNASSLSRANFIRREGGGR